MVVHLTLTIDNRMKECGTDSVFIPMRDFPWHNERNRQLTRLYEAGMIVKPRFFDDGAELRLTRDGKKYLEDIEPLTKGNEKQEMQQTVSKSSRPSVFISYNWGSDEIADEVDKRLRPYADVKRDKSSIEPWGNIRVFMDFIRDQDFVVISNIK